MLLPTLSDDQRRRAGREILKFRHRLEETGLFGDAALARLIDETPRAALAIRTRRENAGPDEPWIAGEAGGLEGAELIAAVRKGRLCISPQAPHLRYGRVLDRLMADFERETGVAVGSARLAVIMSSPRMSAPRETAFAEAMRLNVRGRTALDFDAAHVPLQPGEALYWPQQASHHMVPGDDFNVAVAVDFDLRPSWLQIALRRARGRPTAAAPAPAPLTPRFDVALAAEDCLRWRRGQRPDWAAKPHRKAA
jgi:hypothetical protein